MRLYALGPVEMYEETFEIGGSQVPYFRNKEFSDVVNHCMAGMKTLLNSDEDSESIFLTCSGTGGMEAVVINCFTEEDNLLIIDGGSFGHRFVELCEIHHIPHTPVVVPRGVTLTRAMLDAAIVDKKFTGLLVNIHESSTGQLYDKAMLSQFCQDNNLIFIVDAISSFLADEVDMKKYGMDCVIVSSQKGLALAPGLTIVTINKKLVDRIQNIDSHCMYLDFKDHIKNGVRGQTPFTPAVRVILELQARLKHIENQGYGNLLENAKATAFTFREKIKEIGLAIPDYPISNACTPVLFPAENALAVYQRLIDEYGYVVNPSGGDLANKLFRVGHIGNHSPEDSVELAEAIDSICKSL